jgi:hypothetical protein
LKYGSTQRFHISETETFRSANGRQTGQLLPGEHFASCAESRGPYTAHYAIQLFEQVGATRIEQYSEMEAGGIHTIRELDIAEDERLDDIG